MQLEHEEESLVEQALASGLRVERRPYSHSPAYPFRDLRELQGADAQTAPKRVFADAMRGHWAIENNLHF